MLIQNFVIFNFILVAKRAAAAATVAVVKIHIQICRVAVQLVVAMKCYKSSNKRDTKLI